MRKKTKERGGGGGGGVWKILDNVKKVGKFSIEKLSHIAVCKYKKLHFG